MANEPDKPPKVSYTAEFKRNLRHLAKKYRHIRDDVQPIIDQLAAGASKKAILRNKSYKGAW